MERIDKLETIVKRLMRRSNKVAKALVTPFPIANCVVGENISGTVLRYMFPSSGKILKGGVFLDSKPKEAVTVGFSISNSLGGSSKTYIMQRQNVVVEPDVTVQSWDRLDISLYPVGETIIKEAWVAFLWTPDVKELDVKTCLIEELEAQINDEDPEGNEEVS